MNRTAVQVLFDAVDYYRKVQATAPTWHGSWSRRDAADSVVAAACAMVDEARKPNPEREPEGPP